MKTYKLSKNGVVTNMWDETTGDETYYQPSFGRLARWVFAEAEGEDISTAIDIRDVTVVAAIEAQPEVVDPETGQVTQLAIDGTAAILASEYLIPGDFSIEIEDKTAEMAQQALVQDGKHRQEIGAAVIAKVYSINEGKNISTQTFMAMIADPNLERIERMLWTGSLRTAKMMISALDTTYFTAGEKQSILAMLTNY